METSVIIPTYRRSSDLQRCLEGLSKQSQFPDEVIIVIRDTDKETLNFLKNYKTSLSIKKAKVTYPGQVAALNTGLDASSGEVVCILDDDTFPHPHWLKRITDVFNSSEQIGGVGGRDWVIHDKQTENGRKEIVGKVQWFGRVIGNHHLGYGEPRDVDVLKGANMSYRRKAIEGLSFDERLLGNGAQVHNDMAFSLSVKRRGWRLVYDPDIAVDHFPAQRFDLDKRDFFNKEAYFNSVYNETLIMFDFMQRPFQRVICVMWWVLIGTKQRPGLLQFFRLFLMRPNNQLVQRFTINLRTRFKAEYIRKKMVRSLSQ